MCFNKQAIIQVSDGEKSKDFCCVGVLYKIIPIARIIGCFNCDFVHTKTNFPDYKATEYSVIIYFASII